MTRSDTHTSPLLCLAACLSLAACSDDQSIDDDAATEDTGATEATDSTSTDDEVGTETGSTSTSTGTGTSTDSTDTSEATSVPGTDDTEEDLTETDGLCEMPGRLGPVEFGVVEDLPWPEFGVDSPLLEILTDSDAYLEFFQAPLPDAILFPDEWLVTTSSAEPFPHSAMAVTGVEVTGLCDLEVELTRTQPGPSCETFETFQLTHAAARFPAPFPVLAGDVEVSVVDVELDCGAIGVSEFQSCTQALPCAPGLLCAGLTRGDTGMCMDASLRGAFESQGPEPIAANGELTVPLIASDLATVDMDVIVSATIQHPDPAALTITLTNPSGNEVLVWDNEEGPAAYPWLEFDGELVFHRTPVGFSGDESVNGTWFLKIVDTDGGGGELLDWGIEVMSRFD